MSQKRKHSVDHIACSRAPNTRVKYTPRGLRIEDTKYTVSFQDVKNDTSILNKRLLDDGVVVVTGVIAPSDNDTMIKEYESDIQAMICAKKSDGSVESYWNVAPRGNGGNSLFKHRAAPLSNAAQKRRLNRNVKQLFQYIYGENEELTLSLDAYAFQCWKWIRSRKKAGQPPASAPYARKVYNLLNGSTLKLHVDSTSNGYCGKVYSSQLVNAGMFPTCVQGCMVNQEEFMFENAQGKYDTFPSFVCCPRSWSQSVEFKGSRDWCVLNEEQIQKHMDDMVMIPAPAGSVRLWRSDIIHANSLASEGCFKYVSDKTTMRAAQFICWGPRQFCSQHQSQLKKEYARDGWSHNHNPVKATKGDRGKHRSDQPHNPLWVEEIPFALLPETLDTL